MGKFNSIKFKVIIPMILLLLLLGIMLIGRSHQLKRLRLINMHMEVHNKLRSITADILYKSTKSWIKVLKFIYEGKDISKIDYQETEKYILSKLSEYYKYNIAEHKELYETDNINKQCTVNIQKYEKERKELKGYLIKFFIDSESFNNISILNYISFSMEKLEQLLQESIILHDQRITELSSENESIMALSEKILLIVVVIFILLILSLTFLQSMIISKPIIQLQEWAKKVHSTGFHQPIEIINRDEIGSLACILNEMVVELDKNYKEIEKSNNKLKIAYNSIQDIVNERTIELKMKNQDIEDFCGSISSDLRAPLRAIREFLNIAFEENYQKLDDDVLRLFNIAMKNVNIMGDIIEDLVKFSKIAMFQLDYVEVNMHDLINKKFREISSRVSNNEIDFQIENISNLVCDYNLFKVLWENLIDNAIKFSSLAPKPSISVFGDKDHSFVHYTIKDNGVGFDNSKSNDIFSLFRKLHYKEDFEGNGIGLSLVKKIVDKHGGFITLESSVNLGTSIILSFPIKAKIGE